MKYTRYVLFVCLMMLSVRSLAQSSSVRDSLHDAGLIRPIQLIEQDIRWNKASTDLFTTWLDNGLYGFYGPQPTIMVDGIPIDANFFGWQNLNMLPIFVANVEQTTSRIVPQVYNHTLASGGLINFQTAPIDTGWSGRASYYVGNESGDPGPYIYDSLKTSPNIDRWGPDAALSLSYRHGGWYSRGTFIFRKHQPTDLNPNLRLHITNSILGTNVGYVNHPIYIKSKSGMIETGYQADKWKLKGRYSFGTSEDYIFLQPFGREVPAKTGYQQVAFQGSYSSGRWLIKGRYMAHKKTINRRIDLHTYIFNWQQWTHTTALSARYDQSWFRLKSGLIYQRWYTSALGVNDGLDVITTFYVNGELPLGTNSKLFTQNNLDFYGNTIAGTVRLGASLKATDHWRIIPEAFYSQVLPIRQHSFAYWMSRGYTFAERLDIEPKVQPFVYENKLLSLKLSNQFGLTPRLTLKLAQQFTHHYWLNIPWQKVNYKRTTHTLPGVFTISRTSGERFSFLTELQHTISSVLQQSLSLYLQSTLSGSKRYKDYFEQIPNTKISYQVDVRPVPDLILSMNISYRSSTQWKEFEAIEGNEYTLPVGIPMRRLSGTFHIQTPAYTNIDLSIQKWFLNRHLSTQFTVQNLLNEEVRMHPLGAKMATKFNVKVGVQF